MLGGSVRSSNVNLVVVIRGGFTGDAGEAREACLSGANNPNRRTTPTSRAFPVGVDGVLEPSFQVCTVGAGIRTQMKFDVLVKSYERKSGPQFVVAMFCLAGARSSNQIWQLLSSQQEFN